MSSVHKVLNGGQPSPLDLSDFSSQGVKTVINLRAPTEDLGFDERALCEQLKLDYRVLPIAGPEDLTRDHVKAFDSELTDALSKGDVLVHCGTSNRVGALMALREVWLRGTPQEPALEIGRQFGLTVMEDAVRNSLGRDTL